MHTTNERQIMRHLRVISMAIFAVLALGAFATSAFAALPSFLPETELTFTGKSVGATKLQSLGSLAVECSSATAEGTIKAGKSLGPFHITFKGCKSAGGPCTGSGEATEVILVLGEYHIVPGLPGITLILFLISPSVHFTCTILGIKVLILVSGEVACEIPAAETNKKVKSFKFKCAAGKEGGDPGVKSYKNDEGKEVSLTEGLLTELEENGKPEMSSQAGEGTVEPTKPEIEIMA